MYYYSSCDKIWCIIQANYLIQMSACWHLVGFVLSLMSVMIWLRLFVHYETHQRVISRLYFILSFFKWISYVSTWCAVNELSDVLWNVSCHLLAFPVSFSVNKSIFLRSENDGLLRYDLQISRMFADLMMHKTDVISIPHLWLPFQQG